ncbi:MAG: 50S ribosomal protein L17 [Planctomycetota bacterium]
MRHQMAKKHLGRTPSHRLAMRRNMARSLFTHGAVRTTEPKAKDLRRFVERLVTIARKGTLHARRRVLRELGDREIVDEEGVPTGQTVIQKLFADIAPQYADRPGGYTRIIRLQERRIGDGGQSVMLQLVGETVSGEGGGAGSRKRRAAKRHAAAAAAEGASRQPAGVQTEQGEESAPEPEAAGEEQAETGEQGAETQQPPEESSDQQGDDQRQS